MFKKKRIELLTVQMRQIEINTSTNLIISNYRTTIGTGNDYYILYVIF